MERKLTEHQPDIDRQLNDILNKQNALVQNLSHQIDSFNRVTQTQSADLTRTSKKLDELASAFHAHKTRAELELAALAASVADLTSLLSGIIDCLRSQGDSISD